MTSLRCSSKLTESTIKGHIKDNEGSLKTVETTEASATNTQTTLTARADTQMTLTARAGTQMTLTARADTQMTLTARAGTQRTLTARADIQITRTARADTQMTLTARADTQMTLTACANTQMTLTARANTQVTLTAPSSFCAPSSSSLSSLLSLLRCCSYSIFFCLLLNVSFISFASSASFICSFSLRILPSCSSSPSSSLASCVALQTQDRQKNSTTNVNETKFKLKSLQIL